MADDSLMTIALRFFPVKSYAQHFTFTYSLCVVHVAQNAMGTQYVLYWSDAVQVTYAGGTCLQLSPCGTTFICEQPFSADRQHPIHGMSTVSAK